VHGDWGVAKVVGEVLGERLHGGFGGVVGRVAGWVGDALFAAGYDDGAGRVFGAELGNEGVETVDNAEEIGLEDLRLEIELALISQPSYFKERI
jgi:hypothetical protein